MLKNISLKGNSGCKLFIYEDGEALRVRKISPNITYNERLDKQMLKQRTYGHDNFRTPKVIDSGYTSDGLFFFDMEYINGITLAEYFSTINLSEINRFCDIVCSLLPVNLKPDNSSNTIFHNKLRELSSNLEHNTIISKALKMLNQADFSFATRSVLCHGDLTLENIIVCKNQLYLIDFLDSFHNTYIIDISKIFQDLELMWSYRNTDNTTVNLKLRLITAKQLILKHIRTLKYGQDIISTLYSVLLMNTLRIFPYIVDDEKTSRYLYKQLEYIITIKETYI